MRRRSMAIPAAVGALVLILAGAPPAEANNPVFSGSDDSGDFRDLDFLANSHEVQISWIRASRSEFGRGYWAGQITPNNLPDYDGQHTCIQITGDWEEPFGGNHYDARVWRDCYANHTWSFAYLEPANLCSVPAGPINCDAPMHRIMFARYVQGTGQMLGKECWVFHDDGPNNQCPSTEDWPHPECFFENTDPTYCQYWIRQRDGDVILHESDPTNPNTKRPGSLRR